MQIVAAADVTDDYLECTDHIAYQHSNLIQPHILFFNVNRQGCAILNVSTNVANWLGIDAKEIVGKTLGDDLFPGISIALKAMEHQRDHTALIFTDCVRSLDGEPQSCRIFATPSRWLIELESALNSNEIKVDGHKLERLLLDAIQSLSSDATVQELVDHTTHSLRELLGYERGMCYQFDDDNNGKVIAESTSLPSEMKFLGLRFPSRDIPRTAREMLLASPLRTTVDQRLECHEIFPCLDPQTQQYVDLTHVRGRGAAGSCREYYLNLNIRSSLVLPLIVENRLWGLLSFHDQQVRCVSPCLDEHLQSIASCLSVFLDRNLKESREQARRKGSQVVADLSEVDSTSDLWLTYIQSKTADLKDLITCDGFILRLSGEIITSGIVPDGRDRQHFTDAVWELTGGKALRTNCLHSLCHELGNYSRVASGVIAIPLSAHHNDIAIWIRAEQKQTMQWAGDPLKNIETDPTGRKRLCVRESFEIWTRVTERKCIPWTEQELCLATSASMQIGLLTLSWHAAQASKAKSQFLSCMSHEIRTPMTAILGYANLLKEQQQSSVPSSQTYNFIDVIERNGMHLLSVIDDILNLAKIEAGKLILEQIPISISSFLTDVVALIRVQADAKHLDFRIELKTPIPETIYGDAVRLRQILLNLLGNAFKFTEHGSVSLAISYDSLTRQITFEVIDSGIGMTEAQIGRLFNAFTQADNSTTRRFGGSGLGLNISQHLAQLLGGGITVQSNPGVGSTFCVSISSGCSDQVDLIHQIDHSNLIASITEPGVSTKIQIPTQLPSLHSLRIMLLEDGEDNQRLLLHILKNAGAEVSIFANGKLGIESLTMNGQLDSPLRTPFPYDMILTDMQMPELDGYSTALLLRQKGCTEPIIALTAFAMQGNDEECFRSGCDDYLSKPLTRKALLEMCAKWRPLKALLKPSR